MPYQSRFWPIETEHGLINKGISAYQGEVGQDIVWFSFDTAEAAADDETDIYDEGTAANPRRWKAGIKIPVYSIIREEGAEVPSGEGFYTVDTIHFSALLEQLKQRGLPNVYDAQSKLFDRIVWDGMVWEIRRYQIQGRLAARNLETVVGIDATRVKSEEMVNDPDFAAYATP